MKYLCFVNRELNRMMMMLMLKKCPRNNLSLYPSGPPCGLHQDQDGPALQFRLKRAIQADDEILFPSSCQPLASNDERAGHIRPGRWRLVNSTNAITQMLIHVTGHYCETPVSDELTEPVWDYGLGRMLIIPRRMAGLRKGSWSR